MLSSINGYNYNLIHYILGKTYEGVAIATQHFKEIPDDVIDKLIKQGDVMMCCGGFTIEHMEEYLG